MLSHVGAGALVLVVSFGFFARGWIGGGDAKLAAATAIWLGFGYLMNYLVYASLLGGALTFLLSSSAWCRCRGCSLVSSGRSGCIAQGGDIPYGIALAGAALLIYPETPWMKIFGMYGRRAAAATRARSATKH